MAKLRIKHSLLYIQNYEKLGRSHPEYKKSFSASCKKYAESLENLKNEELCDIINAELDELNELIMKGFSSSVFPEFYEKFLERLNGILSYEYSVIIQEIEENNMMESMDAKIISII